MSATCETNGHLYGPGSSCVFCGVGRPSIYEADHIEALKELLREAEAENATFRRVFRSVLIAADRIREAGIEL